MASQWRWQGYHVQVEFQSSVITNGTYKKWRTFWKNELQRGTVWIFQKPKNQKIQSSYGEQNKRTTRPWRQNLNMNHVIRKKLTEANLKKAFRIKLFELCKTRTKKSSPDLINFYVISARHDMAIDAGRATRCKWQFKAPWLQTERTKNEEPSEKLSFNGEQFEIFKPKKTRNSNHLMESKTKEPQDPERKNWTWTHACKR